MAFGSPLDGLADFEPLENERNINRESDFDNQTATDIILTPGVFYKIGASFSTSKKFTTQGGVMEGLRSASIITFTGSGSMFTNTDGTFRISDIFIDCPGATVFECIGDDTGNVGHRVNATGVVVISCLKVMTSTGAGAQIFDLVQVGNLIGTTAFSFTGTSPAVVFNFSRVAVFNMIASSIGFDFGSTVVEEVEIGNVILSGDATATAISGLPSSGNITPNNLGMVDNCNFSDFTTQLSGISEDDIRWRFNGNAQIPNSKAIGMVSVNNNVTETAITTINTPVKMNATFVTDVASGFIADGTGRLTFISETDEKLAIDGTATLLTASGGSDTQVSSYIAINGTEVDSTVKQGTATSTKAAPLSMIWEHNFTKDDFIEVFLENNTGMVNLVGKQAVLRIR